ncbi:Ykud domain-containing protein [Frankia canadensis]|uniref:Ykud domain-containing protein n=1 Tax=Frankia canadensis TaxID=1836972 RepID=A0A2I2KVG8_9ACTN|nr:L,D-transpeptidase [Frankia canadensis]SNQ49659.1 Ykud domain-containing protein [Frankia canadensis]SOU56949.1 Ykud domain-containing protein [Frankia canadensis]
MVSTMATRRTAVHLPDADPDRATRRTRPRGTGRHRCACGPLAAGLLAVEMIAVGMLSACAGGDPPAPRPPTTTTPAAHAPRPTAAPAAGRHLVAWAVNPEITWYADPNQDTARGRLANPNEQGAPLVFAVVRRWADWLQVLLPVRPNGSRGWLRAADVRLSETPYALRVDRAAHRLTVLRDGAVLARLPVGIGTGTTPTPSGEFYLTELLRPSDPAGPWGPLAFGLSGFSDVITSFNGADGIIGLHGTNRPDLVGTDASLGCVRLRNEDIIKLAGMVPVGTPVAISP